MHDRLRDSRRRFLANLSALGMAGALAADAPASDGTAPRGVAGSAAAGLDLARVRCADFAACLATPFVVRPPESGPVVLELVRARELRRARQGEPRNPFSVLFRASAAVRLSQDTYPVEHARLGSFALFLVPTGRPGADAIYEAIFG